MLGDDRSPQENRAGNRDKVYCGEDGDFKYDDQVGATKKVVVK